VRACARSSTASRSASATSSSSQPPTAALTIRLGLSATRLVRFADELQDTCGVSDGVWSALAELDRDD
jgi:hypothetical protein